jgi:solute carrier family 45 protein 1/2/4
VYSTVSFISAWILPALIQAPEDETFTHRPPASLAPFIETFNKVKPDLLTAWIASNILFALAMFFTPFATSFRFATVIVAFCGIPWCVSQWAPVTFLGVEVNKLSGSSGPADVTTPHRRLSNDTTNSIEMLHLEHGTLEAGTIGGGAGGGGHASTGELSGIYFGIYNIYVTIPQFLSTVMSGAVFSLLEPGKSPELATEAHPSEHSDTTGPNAIAVCMFFGALSSLVAAWSTRKLRDL